MALTQSEAIVQLGILMGLADAIPGVSGGTVAFLLGFYKKLVNSLSSVVIFLRNLTPLKIDTKNEPTQNHCNLLL